MTQVWNFSNGACIKTLEKPRAADLRQEVVILLKLTAWVIIFLKLTSLFFLS